MFVRFSMILLINERNKSLYYFFRIDTTKYKRHYKFTPLPPGVVFNKGINHVNKIILFNTFCPEINCIIYTTCLTYFASKGKLNKIKKFCAFLVCIFFYWGGVFFFFFRGYKLLDGNLQLIFSSSYRIVCKCKCMRTQV